MSSGAGGAGRALILYFNGSFLSFLFFLAGEDFLDWFSAVLRLADFTCVVAVRWSCEQVGTGGV